MTRAQLIAALRAHAGARARARARDHDLHVYQEELLARQDELKSALVALELSRDQYRELFDFSPLPYVVLDANGVVVRLNLAMATLLQTDRVHVDGMPFLVHVRGRDRRAFLEHMRRCRAAADPVVVTELVLKLRDGDAIPVEVTSRASLRSQDMDAFQTTVVDLRERHAAELERLRAVAERERILADQRAAREASEAKDRFLAVLSHELRTPLTPVMLATSTWKDEPSLPEPFRKTLAMIGRNVGTQARLIDDLLDMTRITQGKLALSREPIDLHTIVEEVYEQARPELAGAALEGVLALRAGQCHVSADPLRLRQIVWNLLKNAIRFTPAGGTITLATADVPGSKVRLSVTDTGVGFTPETAAAMFEPFRQGPRSSFHGGIGLGLAIAKGLVEAHEGTISASSDGPARGACFVVELPAMAGAIPAPSPQPTDGAAALPHGRLKILLVEDHEDTAQALAYVLEHAGYSVALAHSVAQAIAASDARDIDVVVSDLGLPDGSGLDLMRHLQAQDKATRGIALTGYGRREDLDETTRAGFHRHLTKPVDVPTLIAAIESLRPRAA